MCTGPLKAYQAADGSVLFHNSRRHDVVRELSLACGQCIECRLARSRRWAMRCMHEASLHRENSFITLTYRPENLPDRGQLVYSDFQKFMKRWRKAIGPVRFYMCGEYGEQNWRPHFHSCMFGKDLPDKKFLATTQSGDKLYTSDILDSLWPYGFASVGAVTFQSAAYVARYCVQKMTGPEAERHYARVDARGAYQLVPEFNHMSLKPGIGAPFLEKWKTDVYPNDYVIINGQKCAPPKYYDKILKRENPEMYNRIGAEREARAWDRREDETPDRLAARHAVTRARASMLIRGMDDYGS